MEEQITWSHAVHISLIQTKGGITDLDGKFSLLVKGRIGVEITYRGTNHKSGSEKSINTAVLPYKSDTKLLDDEVVVVGYGVRKR